MDAFTDKRSESVFSLGEIALIELIKRWLGDISPCTPFGIGDDCAVLEPSNKPQLVTTDPVIFGTHVDANVSGRAAGKKLLNRNLSDIAAMGGCPRAAVLSLALPAETSITWLRDFYRGIASTARQHGVKIVGGDITDAHACFFGAFLTLHGEAASERVVTRQGARAGDLIYVTGRLGGSRIRHHYSFTPRLAEGAWLAAQPAVRAMIDLSDGLAKDILSITPVGVKPALFGERIPISNNARRWAKGTGLSPLHHALSDGEDFELLFVVDYRADQSALQRNWKKNFQKLPLTCIGHFSSPPHLPAGTIRLEKFHGYEHLR